MEAFVADLSDRAIFHVKGADRERFLNGQVSNEVRKLPSNKMVPACLMTAKGKMHGLIWVWNSGDFLQFDIEAELRESVVQRLERYIISDDVTIEDVTHQAALIHMAGGGMGSTAPFSKRFGVNGYDTVVPRGELAQILSTFPAEKISTESLEQLRIENGIPKWGAELTTDTLPPEAGLDATAISYNKGCYVGQEVISRIKSVGQVARILRGLVPLDGQPLAAGAKLLVEASIDAKPAGIVTSAIRSSRLNHEIGLGYVKRAFAEPGGRVWLDQSGVLREVVIRELPFLPL